MYKLYVITCIIATTGSFSCIDSKVVEFESRSAADAAYKKLLGARTNSISVIPIQLYGE